MGLDVLMPGPYRDDVLANLPDMTDPGTFEARRTSFGAAADVYQAVRPRWPEAVAHWLLGSPERPLKVLDLGAGTGLGTVAVAMLGHEVVAVEPSAGMLRALRASAGRLAADTQDRITLHEGPAEDLAEPDASVDAVTCFQAWHWFDHARAATECARVIRPGGVLGLAWNSWDGEAAWVRELAEIVGTPEMVWDPEHEESGLDRPVVEGFDPPENVQLPLEHSLTVDELVLLASSWSPVAVRDDRDDVLRRVRELGARTFGRGSEQRLTFPYVSDCYRFRRTP
jgi:SAM-dependent methyltransferase